MIFRNPSFLILLVLVPFLIYWATPVLRKGAVRYSTTDFCREASPTWKVRWYGSLPWLQVIALVLVIVALARPQIGLKESLVRREGVDIVLTLDVSTSMLAEDFQILGRRQNRLEVVKDVTKDFIAKRPNDRVGIVIFAGRPYILSPLTWDHDWSESRLGEVKAGMVEDGTAIGSALTTAINRLRESKAKSKVVILLTDGMNNAGTIMPEMAAEAAKAMGVTVYTIGAGSKGLVPYPVTDSFGRKGYQRVQIDLDEELLGKIAQTTNGRYFRATDTESLKEIFSRIDKMEKTAIEMHQYQDYQETYPYLLGLALLFFLAELVLSNTIFRRLP
jgi:Ca-activated chloride channel homolog